MTKPIEKTKRAFIVWSNTDLTEGKGSEFPRCICELKSTALRLGRGQYVQGTDCRVTPVDLIYREKRYWGPVYVMPPSYEDEAEEKRRIFREDALKKARELGLSDDEIKAIMQWPNPSGEKE